MLQKFLINLFKWSVGLLAFFPNASGQSSQFYFQKVSAEHGLSHNKVNCILQDKRGFIWFGTEDGLNRYDGHNFLVFRKVPGKSTGISGNIITDLAEDKKGIIWIATSDGGLSKYDYRLPPSKQFKRFYSSANPSEHFNNLNTMLDLGEYLWLGTSGSGLVRFNKETEIFDKPDLKDKRTITDLCLDGKGIIWVGRQGGGLLKANPKTLKLEMDSAYKDLYAKLPHVVITSIYKDRNDKMWFGSWDNLLYCHDPKTKKKSVFGGEISAFGFGSDEALAFNEDALGNIWIGTKNTGLYIYNPRNGKFTNLLNDPSKNGTISDNRINSIYRDRAGIIWVGTNKGISKFISSQQKFVQEFIGSEGERINGTRGIIYDIFTDKGNTWVGSNNGLFIKENGKSGFNKIPLTYKNFPLQITKIYKAQDKTIYLGSNYSLFQFDPTTQALTLLNNTEKDVVMNKIIASRVVSVVETKIEGNPVLLVSPYGHFLTYYDLINKRWISRADSTKQIIKKFNIKDNLIKKLIKTRDGTIWLATAKEGLGEWTQKEFPYIKFYNNNPKDNKSLSNNSVFDVSEDLYGNLWISTYGGGLNFLDTGTKKFTHIKDSKNLLEGISIDRKGNVWMISTGSLYKYDPLKKTFSSYNLPDTEKSGGVKGYIYKDHEGYFYVTGTNYFIKFNPDAVEDKTNIEKPIFTDLKIFNASQSHLIFQKEINLKYNQNFLIIDYSSPEFSGSDNIYYSYKLEGLDKKWTEAGSKTFAGYTNLNPGKYIFKVRTSLKRFSSKNDIATLNITIGAPFWQRWWFYTVIVLAILLLLYALYSYRINEIIKRQAIRNKIAQDLHDNIGSTLSSIAIYSHVANLKNKDKNNSELESLLDKITNTSQQMIEEMKDIVWTINPRNDSMEKIIQRMESFAKPLLAAKEIQLHMSVEESLFVQTMGMEKRNNLYLIFKEVINNALKYSNCKNIYVALKLKHNQVVFSIKDDGIGFDLAAYNQKSSTGNGVNNIKSRVEAMDGKSIITSEINRGTTIYAEFPIP